MARRRLQWVVMCFWCLLCGSLAARAAEDVLAVVPQQVLGVAVVNRLAETSGKVGGLAKQMVLPVPDLLTLLKASAGLQAGLDENGCLAVAAMPAGDAGMVPVPVGFVPVKDYAAFLAQFKPAASPTPIASVVIAGKKSLVARKGGFAVVAAEAQRASLEAVLNAPRSLAAETAALDAWRRGQDGYAIATAGGIKMFQQQVLAGLAVAKAQLEKGDAKTKQAAAGLAMYEALFAALPNEVACAALGVRIEPDGTVHVASRTLPRAGGVLAKLTQQPGPAPADPLAGLPAGPFVLAGGGIFPADWIKPLMRLSWTMMKMYPGGELTDQQIEQLTQVAIDSMKGLKSMTLRMGIGKGNEPLYGDMLITMRVDDAPRYLANYERAMRRTAQIGKDAKNPMFSYEVEKIEMSGHAVLKMTIDLNAYVQGQDLPQVKQMFEMMFGPGGKMSAYFAAADAKTVVGVYVSPNRLFEAIQAVRGGAGLAADAGVVQTAAKLPAGAQWVGFWSPRGTQQFVTRLLKNMMPDAPIKVPDFPDTAPIGMAMKMAPGQVDTDLVVPAEILGAGAKFVRDIIAGQQTPRP